MRWEDIHRGQNCFCTRQQIYFNAVKLGIVKELQSLPVLDWLSHVFALLVMLAFCAYTKISPIIIKLRTGMSLSVPCFT